jgi:hypothetical protein
MAPEPIRTPASRLLSVLCIAALAATPAHALRVVSHNILNYPGSTGATRDPFYRTILAPLSPDVFVAEEMTSAAGCTEFLGSLNTMEPGQWANVPFIDGNDTDTELFYKPAKVQFLGQWAFYPNPANLLRYVHVYRVKPVGYSSDAAEFRIYALHLKASLGFEAQRLAEATGLRDSLNAMPPGTHALVVGDYNFYTGTEPGFLKLLESQANNIGRLYDPLGLQGIPWQDNTTMQYAWTQSTCKTGDTGCASGAATGGLDDRFDLILPTTTWQDGAGLELVPGTYISVGNDGLHHNNSIQDPPTIPEGADYATALHSVSDHLPVRVDLRLPALLAVSGAPIAFGNVIVGAGASQSLLVENTAPVPGETLTYTYAPPAGFSAPVGLQAIAAGGSQSDGIALDTATPGARAGSLVLTSNSVDAPVANLALSGTVLRHAVPSLDSATVVPAALLDFGTHAEGEFSPFEVRVHDQGWDALQAQLVVSAAGITGGDGRFSVSGTVPVTLAGIGATYEVMFDAAGATADSVYTATLTFDCGDEALPGAQPASPLTVSLSAQRQGGGSVAVGGGALPSATRLLPPSPNPLGRETQLRFDLARAGQVRLDVFDAAGRRVASLLDAALEPGRYSLNWSGRNDGGQPLGAGLYFVHLVAPGAGAHTARLAIVR